MAGKSTAADLTGQRFGRLTVIKRAPYSLGGTTWLCKCTCGADADATTTQLTHGYKRSCGCLTRQKKEDRDGEA